jgi:hypothetical protein
MLPMCITRAQVDSGRLCGPGGKRTYDPRARLVSRAFEPRGRQLLRGGRAIASGRGSTRPGQTAARAACRLPARHQLRSPTHALLGLSRLRNQEARSPTSSAAQFRALAKLVNGQTRYLVRAAGLHSPLTAQAREERQAANHRSNHNHDGRRMLRFGVRTDIDRNCNDKRCRHHCDQRRDNSAPGRRRSRDRSNLSR